MGIGLSSLLQSQPNIFIYRRLGWKFAFYYTHLLGRLYFILNRKDKRKIKKSVHSVFYELKNHSERRSTTLAVFRGIIFHYYEKLFNAFSSAETLKTFFNVHMKNDDMTAIEKGLFKGNGVLLVTGHFGGVEFMPGYLASMNYPVTIIVRFSSKTLRNISTKKAREFSARILDADHTPNIMRSLIDNLKENRIVITQCDEIKGWKSSKNDRVSFLGKDIHLDRTLDVIIKRANPTIVFGVMHRESDHQYRFIATSQGDMEKGHLKPDKIPFSRLALSFLEDFIYRYPREWYQWKQYADVITVPPLEIESKRTVSLRLLKTSLDKIS
ncbi:MAG: hypothetical protein AMK69_13660 [Nitrospira bacterium SG8_3]|nr:MAG: hypothetical protein AMK69_13660 [Nitrospira bacterium SG8_3]